MAPRRFSAWAATSILTRLLAPQVFGLMALVNVIIQGLKLFTDIGIGPSIIQNKRGEDPVFLNTAWTLQILRGLGITIICAIAAYPASLIYRDPKLIALIAVTGLNTFVGGLGSIHLHTYNKQLKVGWLTFVDIATQVLTIVATVILAYYWRNVWALVVGTLISSAVRAVWSYIVFRGPPHRFVLDRGVMKEMFHFGKWITISTCLTFLVNSGDRLVLGRYLTCAELGVYTIGFLIPQAIIGILQPIGSRVIFPLCVKLLPRGMDHFRPRIFKIKWLAVIGLLPPLWIITIFAQTIINTLFDARYHDAGWILRLFATSTAVPVITLSLGAVLFAQGDSYRAMLIILTRLIGTAVSVGVGAWLGGKSGMIVGFAVASLVTYPQMAWYARRTGTWFPKLDIFGLTASLAALAIGWRLGL